MLIVLPGLVLLILTSDFSQKIRISFGKIINYQYIILSSFEIFMQKKYIVVSGGVVSGIGKGVSTASIGLLMKMRGYRVKLIKLEPYHNYDASTIKPADHGEVFVTDDGIETDLDLGTYERITGINVSQENIWTSGKLQAEISQDERAGKYLGQTIQVNPHITKKIQDILIDFGTDTDIVVAEIGGTVGDWESFPFFVAVQQFKRKLGEDNFLLMHVAPVLWINTIGEFKTKPLQKSIIELRQFGLEPDILLSRSDRPLNEKILQKISDLTDIERNAIFEAPDVKSIYQVPITFYDKNVDDFISDRFKLKRTGVKIQKYRELVEKYINAENLPELTVGVVGKYTNATDAYLSLKEAIYHAGVKNNCKINIRWIDAEKLEEYSTLRGINKFFEGINCVIVPGGFDNRGTEGKIKAIQFVREKKIPFLGICLGLQCAVIEFARNVCELTIATSEEFQKPGQDIIPVIHYVSGLRHQEKLGGTLRLGSHLCQIALGSLANKVYNCTQISERHRHRFEVNNEYLTTLCQKGMVISGINPEANLVEMIELPSELHPFFIACQFHPEFKSRLTDAHPLFDSLISVAKSSGEKSIV